MEWRIEEVSEADFEAVLALNEAVVPAVNSLAIADLDWFRRHAAYFRLARNGDGLAGFMIGMSPGSDYRSPNYRWFCRRYDDFAYVDRVAVSPPARGKGLARGFYDDFVTSLPGRPPVLTCEVNLEPPNEGSLRFHEKLGFVPVGSQRTERGRKRVSLLAKTL